MELKGFHKVSIAPGETIRVDFVVSPDMLKFYDVNSSDWALEKGSFTAYVGSSSDKILGKVSFEVK